MIVEALCYKLFTPWEEKKRLMNKFFFQYEAAIDVLIKIYRILVGKEWGDLGIDEEDHMYLEDAYCRSIIKCGHTNALLREVVQLGGLEMCMKTLLRRQLRGEECDPNGQTYDVLFNSLSLLYK